jgi:hypothetical protein
MSQVQDKERDSQNENKGKGAGRKTTGNESIRRKKPAEKGTGKERSPDIHSKGTSRGEF